MNWRMRDFFITILFAVNRCVIVNFSKNCKIADFGLSKSDDLTATMASTVLESEYTPAWSAPGLSIQLNELRLLSSLKVLEEAAFF